MKRSIATLSRRIQLERLNQLLAKVLPHNALYAAKLTGMPTQLDRLDQLAELPFTNKDELLPSGEPPLAPANLTYPLEDYVRFHQTSGTRGRPLPVYDTAADWQWWIDCWHFVLDVAGITACDRAMLAFSFGPFIGFWTAFDALMARGALVAPGGGLSSLARIDLMERLQTTALFCTPTYALHLAEVAAQNQIALHHLPIEKIVVAGEPGGSMPAVRERIESTWNARLIDHAGASEIGAWGYADRDGRGLHVLETEFIAEFYNVESGEPAASGELSHLVLTTLGRTGAPLDSLPHRRPGPPGVGRRRRKPFCAPRRRGPGPQRRHAGCPRREPLSLEYRTNPPQLPRSGRVPSHGPQAGRDG